MELAARDRKHVAERRVRSRGRQHRGRRGLVGRRAHRVVAEAELPVRVLSKRVARAVVEDHGAVVGARGDLVDRIRRADGRTWERQSDGHGRHVDGRHRGRTAPELPDAARAEAVNGAVRELEQRLHGPCGHGHDRSPYGQTDDGSGDPSIDRGAVAKLAVCVCAHRLDGAVDHLNEGEVLAARDVAGRSIDAGHLGGQGRVRRVAETELPVGVVAEHVDVAALDVGAVQTSDAGHELPGDGEAAVRGARVHVVLHVVPGLCGDLIGGTRGEADRVGAQRQRIGDGEGGKGSVRRGRAAAAAAYNGRRGDGAVGERRRRQDAAEGGERDVGECGLRNGAA